MFVGHFWFSFINIKGFIIETTLPGGVDVENDERDDGNNDV